MTIYVIIMVALCLLRGKNSMGRIGVNKKQIYYINEKHEAAHAVMNFALAAVGIALVLANYLKG